MDKIVTVVIPTYNRKRHTDRAVASVKSYDPGLVEIIVVDDCSEEPYSYRERLNPAGIAVRVIRCAANVGAGLARKTGVDAAAGDVIAFLDSDDVFCAPWVDAVIREHLAHDASARKASLYVGSPTGGKYSHSVVWRMVNALSENTRLRMCRLVTIFFNPFYTPSIAIAKPLCRFSNRLRHCEDYYTLASAIFRARILNVISVPACVLGRKPNSKGGLSGTWLNMFKGEMSVRMHLLKADLLPVLYRLLVPVGMAYQIARSLMKFIIQKRHVPHKA